MGNYLGPWDLDSVLKDWVKQKHEHLFHTDFLIVFALNFLIIKIQIKIVMINST
ncbi:hypothetical protein BACSP_04485 [Bacillus sp. T2.9-1]|nr:hypothetical protein BACSP_04485 [Bacillus sp. T2.9-1]